MMKYVNYSIVFLVLLASCKLLHSTSESKVVFERLNKDIIISYNYVPELSLADKYNYFDYSQYNIDSLYNQMRRMEDVLLGHILLSMRYAEGENKNLKVIYNVDDDSDDTIHVLNGLKWKIDANDYVIIEEENYKNIIDYWNRILQD